MTHTRHARHGDDPSQLLPRGFRLCFAGSQSIRIRNISSDPGACNARACDEHRYGAHVILLDILFKKHLFIHLRPGMHDVFLPCASRP